MRILIPVVLLLSSCGQPAPIISPGVPVPLLLEIRKPVPLCKEGYEAESGLDYNRNGRLEDSEVQKTYTVCEEK